MSRATEGDPGSLLAVVGDGLIAAGPEREVEIELEVPFEARLKLLELLASGGEPAQIAAAAGAEPEEALELLERLRAAGALPLANDVGVAGPAEAILAAAGDRAGPREIWTAEELLLLPAAGIDPAGARAALRAFVAGLASEAHLRAYCYLATWLEPTVRGDRPGPRWLALGRAAAERLDPELVHVLSREGRVESAPAGELGSLGALEPHRLGTVLEQATRELPGGLCHASARYALPNLAHASAPERRVGRGTAAEPALAGTIARAEAAERYAAGDVGRHTLIRARADELEGTVGMDELYRLGARQLAGLERDARYDPGESYLWVQASGPAGSSAWVPAEAVFFPLADPERERPLASAISSSGVAAHTDPREALERSLRELIERDAFMWHWAQRLSRERIRRRGLPLALGELLEGIESEGFEAHLVNLTLDTHPVLLCVLLGHGWLCPGLACHHDPAAAAAKALQEATSIAATVTAGPPPEPIEAERVATPDEHLRLHRDPKLIRADHFLFSSSETIEIGAIGAAPGPLEEVVAAIGEPLTVDLTSPATAPFHVVRSLVPGMIPITFGYDREPLGMPRLAGPIVGPDGRVLGGEIEPSGPLVPHPFP